MRICLLSREYPPDTGWGGIGTFTHHLAHGLRELGQQVHVVSLTGTESAAPTKSSDSDGITVHRVPIQNLRDRSSLFNFCLPVTRPMLQQTSALWKKFLELHLQQPFDVIECAEHFAEGLFPSMCRVAPMVVRLHTPHSKLVNEKFHNFSPSFDHRVLTMLERLPMMSADILISPSRDLANYVANDLNFSPERIHIVRNPVNVNQFTPDGPKTAVLPDTINILFVGRLEERKGVYYLIQSVSRVLKACPNARFTFIGSDTKTGKGNGSVLQELKAITVESCVEHAVTFVNQVPLSEIPDNYRAADICVLPSLYDNAPMTTIEAMSCGKPVIGTTAGGTKEYVLDQQCGLIVPPANSEALADALILLCNDRARREQMGAFARTHVLENFTRDITARQSLSLYEAAGRRFAERQHPSGIYPGEPEKMLDDMTSLIDAYEQTLYNMMYTNSWRFRFKHWKNRAAKKFARPSL